MVSNLKKGFILFMCTILLVVNISTTCIKPLTVNATGAVVAGGGAVVVEGISILLDLIAAGLVSIGAYELYNNDERMQIVIDSYVDTWKDPTTGVFSPERTWGDVEDTTGTFVRDPNTGQWVRNPDTIPSTERPVILTPEEQEHYGLSSNYYDNVYDAAWEIWQKNHGSGNGGGSGGGDDSGGSNTGNDKGTLVKIGTGVIASVGAFIANVMSGETGNEVVDSWVNEIPEPTYTGTLIPDADGTYIVNCTGFYFYHANQTVVASFTSSNRPFTVLNGGILSARCCPNSEQYPLGFDVKWSGTRTYNGINYPIDSYTLGASAASSVAFSVNCPMFLADDVEGIKDYVSNGDDSSCINKEEPQKLVWADMNMLAKGLSSTLAPFSSLPEGKALNATALKDYVQDMTDYKSTASPSDLSNPDTQAQKATQAAQQAVEKNTVDDKTGTEEKPLPVPTPDFPTPDKITLDGSEATRDWRMVFPFCIPFDIIDLYKVLLSEPKAPYWEIPLRVDAIGFEYTFIIDFKQFETLAEIFRLCETVGFILGLALITGKVIKW